MVGSFPTQMVSGINEGVGFLIIEDIMELAALVIMM